jgi:RNA polymerase subunit RPABC4/transcription elongation factor Spt4
VIASFFGDLHDFFQSGTWSAIQAGGAFFVVILWGATVFWVNKDARRRIGSRVLTALATLLGAIPPFLGPLIYMLFRPPEYIDDVRERELEIRAIERRLAERECPSCRAEVEPDYLMCPVCETKLRRSCTNCARPLEPNWRVCPYCETPVTGEAKPLALRAKASPRTTRRAR